ncbi:MAG: class I SAM-dependent rRNA methyltransferase [Gammaproteobacteria bacterium]|nr:class I SAM-dependent rRNA methyltransferase [Gammaproteobacteria bacterium]
MADFILKPGREKSLKRKHPWVFDGAIAERRGRYKAGDTVNLLDSDRQFLAKGTVSPESSILVRVWSFDPNEPVDHALIKRRLDMAIAARESFDPKAGRRLVHGESDGMPSLVVDQYDQVIVVQFGAMAAERWRETVVAHLAKRLNPTAIYERSDSDGRRYEGLEPETGLLHGGLPDSVIIEENGVKMLVDVAGGHKTGAYLDQRDNRLFVQQHARAKRVLNTFCYTDGFGLHAAKGGATEVVSVDSSASALEIARHNVSLNPDLNIGSFNWCEADVFGFLREQVDGGERYDMVILDPPKFVKSVKHVDRAARAYKDIAMLGAKLLNPGGMLVNFSCSSAMSLDLFRKVTASAFSDANVDGCLIKTLHAPRDHWVSMAFPEGDYLKGFVTVSR